MRRIKATIALLLVVIGLISFPRTAMAQTAMVAGQVYKVGTTQVSESGTLFIRTPNQAEIKVNTIPPAQQWQSNPTVGGKFDLPVVWLKKYVCTNNANVTYRHEANVTVENALGIQCPQ